MGGWAKGAGMGSESGPGAVPPQFRAGLLDPLESLRPPLAFHFHIANFLSCYKSTQHQSAV